MPIYKISILDENSLSPIKEYFEKENIITLVGSSGVGKSTLINKLLGNDVLETQGIREDDGRLGGTDKDMQPGTAQSDNKRV